MATALACVTGSFDDLLKRIRQLLGEHHSQYEKPNTFVPHHSSTNKAARPIGIPNTHQRSDPDPLPCTT
jgi:hypothetical protein